MQSNCWSVLRSIALGVFILMTSFSIGAQQNSEDAKTSKKDKLATELFELSYRPAIELQMVAVTQKVKQSVKKGQTYQGQDISQEDFWNTVTANYHLKKEDEIYQEVKKFIIEKYTEEELAEVVRIFKSDVFKKMISLGFDPENPMTAEKLEKKLRKSLYRVVYQKVQDANVAQAKNSKNRSIASED